MYRFPLTLLILALASNAQALDDLPRIPVSHYIVAFHSDPAKDKKLDKLMIVNYLSGIRDHLWWQCEYKVTVQQLFDVAEFQISAAQRSMSDSDFEEWGSKTPYGDMVFIALRNETLLGMGEPCKGR